MRIPPVDVRRSRRRFSTAAIVAATVALLIAPLPASAAGITVVSRNDHPNADGWIGRAFTDIFVNIDVDFSSDSGVDGQVDDVFTNFTCQGSPGFADGFYSYGGIKPTDVSGRIHVTGEGSHDVECTATYLQRTWSCADGGSCTVSNYVLGTRTYFETVKLNSQAPIQVRGVAANAPNAAGWYHTPITLNFTGFDFTSGIASCSQDTINIQTGPAGFDFTGSCDDHAGNRGSAFFHFRYDSVPPALAPTVTPSVIPLGGSATASANATDLQSGVKSQSCDPLDTSTPGVHTVTCTATDVADNTASATATYTVGYAFSGFAQPVDANARNIAKAGRTIPLKWRVTDAAGAPVTNLTSVKVTASTLSCSTGVTEDQIEEYTTNSSGLQNLGGGSYQFNWSTPKSYASSCKTLRLDLGDGIERTATFEFTK